MASPAATQIQDAIGDPITFKPFTKSLPAIYALLFELGTAGKTLWKAVLGGLADGWQLDERELALLTLACRQADDLSLLEAAIRKEGVTSTGSTGQRTVHAAVPEARQARVTISRLLGQIELPDADEQPVTAASARSRRAAGARWGRKEGMRGNG